MVTVVGRLVADASQAEYELLLWRRRWTRLGNARGVVCAATHVEDDETAFSGDHSERRL